MCRFNDFGTRSPTSSIAGKKNKAICNSLKIKVTLNSMATPAIYINFIGAPTQIGSIIYKTCFSFAQECLSVLQLMGNEVSGQGHNLIDSKSGISEADEILKFKQLLDNGVFTPEEFDMKKKQIFRQ